VPPIVSTVSFFSKIINNNNIIIIIIIIRINNILSKQSWKQLKCALLSYHWITRTILFLIFS
jgi:hypothetical protein